MTSFGIADADLPTAEGIGAILKLLRPLAVQAARAQEAQLEGTRLTPAMWAVVELLAGEGPLGVPAMARRWRRGRQNVQRLVDRLVELELVAGVENPEHRRSALMSLTPAGVTLFRTLRDREERLVAQLTPGLGRVEVAACRRVLLQLDAGLRYLAGRRLAESSP